MHVQAGQDLAMERICCFIQDNSDTNILPCTL